MNQPLENAVYQPLIASWGELLWDIFPERKCLGGSAANVAYHAAKIGNSALLVSRVGDDPLGTQARIQLAQAGVDTSAISTDPHRPTGTVRVEFVDGEPHYYVGRRVAWDCIEANASLMQRLFKADAICFGTLTQRGPIARGRLKAALGKLRSQGHRRVLGGSKGQRPLLILDLNLRPPFTEPECIYEALQCADVIKLNEAEYDWLANTFRVDNLEEFLLEQIGIELIALTKGERGASLIARHVTVEHHGFPAAGGDPVGAGDSFVAVLASELVKGNSLSATLEKANRYAAWVASQKGAMPSAPPFLNR